jgi:hypothetical protein
MTFKVVTLLKRRPGMTMDEFVARYEGVHAKLGERVLADRAIHYERRYLLPLPGADEPADRPHDVVMEIWFADEAAYARAMAALSDPAIAAEIEADEELTFDRSATVMSRVAEHVSALPPVT